MADDLRGITRAALGQGLGMGWGDEGEAWLRSKLSDDDYDQTLARIRQEQGQYSADSPWISGLSEFTGGALPGVAAMLIPGAQGAGAVQLGRTTMQGLAKLGALGAVSGAVSGAGSAKEGDRLQGAKAGSILGGAFGVTIPAALRSGSVASKWLAERLRPSDQLIADRTAEKMLGALQHDGMTPAQMEQAFRANQPSTLPFTGKTPTDLPVTLANTTPGLTAQASRVLKDPRATSKVLEQRLLEQRTGAKGRVQTQMNQALDAKDAYAEADQLTKKLRSKAKGAYDAAYNVGAIDDPQILAALDTPELHKAFELAKKYASGKAAVAKLRGEDPKKYELPDVYKATVDPVTQVMTFKVQTLPDVRTLDYMKKALDADVTSGYLSDDAAKKATAGVTRDLRDLLRDRLKDIVPEYRAALKEYAGDAEVIKALNTGLKDWATMPHEQVQTLVSSMTKSEKEALRTGVARNLHKQITSPSGDANAGQLLSSAKLQERLKPLFDNPAEADLLQAALLRDAQMFKQSGKMLQSSNNANVAGDLADDKAIPVAIHRGMLWGWGNGLASLVSDAVNKGGISDKVAGKLAGMLSAGTPAEVAAVVKTLESYVAAQAPKMAKQARREAGTVTGVTNSIWTPPAPMDAGETLDEVASEDVPNELELLLKAKQAGQ